MAWLSGWSKRKEITLTGGSSGAQTDFQLSLSVTYDSDMLSDFDDLRFTQSDGTTLIDAWCEVKVDDTSATVWVEFPSTPASTVEQTYYMYYGKSAAVDYWDGAETFIGFDNIADGDTTNGPLVTTPSTNLASTNYARSGGYSAKYIHESSTYADKAIWPAALSLDDHLVSFWIYFVATTGRRHTFLVRDTSSNIGMMIKFESGNAYRYSSGAYVDTGLNFTTGWNQIEFIPGATVTPMRMNGGSWVNVNNYASIANFKLTGHVSGSDGVADYFDEYLARKYAVSPATYAFGSEESAPPGGNPFWYYAMLKRRN